MDVHWPYHREEDLSTAREIAQAWRDVLHLHRVNWKNAPISPEQRAHYLDLYERAVAYADAQARRLVEGLDAAGLLENTVLIVVSDHGEEFLERGRWGHFETNLHDEIVRVPLIFRIPGRPGGLVIHHQVSTLDLMPTVLDLAGCPFPDGLQGHSLQALWAGGDATYPARPAISEMWRGEWHIVSIRTPDRKFIWDSRRPDRPALFDLVRDPAEREDIAGREPEDAAEFRPLLERHLRHAAETRPDRPAAAPELDGEMVRRLRDLGYLE
jgi:arylsulfatase A-like enzyme